MTTRTASCRCGQLKLTVEGEPLRVSVCHCLNCKKRSGSAFAVQARWPMRNVTIEGETKHWTVTGDSGNRASFHFCPECGLDMYYTMEGKFEGLVATPVGTFDDPFFASPTYSVWEKRKHDWVEIVGEDVEHND
jgi:hypothetical protein